MSDSDSSLKPAAQKSATPNSLPRSKANAPAPKDEPANANNNVSDSDEEETGKSYYVYRDFAQEKVDDLDVTVVDLHERVPLKKLAERRLPAKLGAMLSDPGE
jgi:hypothetical protein